MHDCLHGVAFSSRLIHEREVREYVHEHWRILRVMPTISLRDDGIWIFRFSLERDARLALLLGAIPLDGAVIQLWRADQDHPGPGFALVDTWIEILGIPAEWEFLSIARRVASALGEVVGTNIPFRGEKLVYAPRLRVRLNLQEPVMPTVRLVRNGRVVDVMIRYRLGEPCLRCGCFGHRVAECSLNPEEVERKIIHRARGIMLRDNNLGRADEDEDEDEDDDDDDDDEMARMEFKLLQRVLVKQVHWELRHPYDEFDEDSMFGEYPEFEGPPGFQWAPWLDEILFPQAAVIAKEFRYAHRAFPSIVPPPLIYRHWNFQSGTPHIRTCVFIIRGLRFP